MARKRLYQDELDYKETLKVQYGFDDKAARIIVKLKRNIYNNPKIRKDRKDYVFTRLLWWVELLVMRITVYETVYVE